MRGSPNDLYLIMFQVGIIPAHAGLTTTFSPDTGSKRDHPRACGAHAGRRETSSMRPGSSPRMRGSLPYLGILISLSGIIPAHAGLTQANPDGRKPGRDHPRACGAHWAVSTGSPDGVGSSPRMRGSRRGQFSADPSAGIIPAHAGLTLGKHFLNIVNRDHLRACGAHDDNRRKYRQGSGSSPRMRGSRN